MARRRSNRRRPPSTGAVLLALFLLLVVYLYRSGALDQLLPPNSLPPSQPGTAGAPPTGLPAQSGDIQVIFTTPSLVYPDNRSQRGPSPLLQAIVTDLGSARTSVDLAVFDLDIPELVDALIGTKERGVNVRVIVDSENLETPEVAEQTGRLESAGIPVIFDNREPFMHNKFIVIDGTIAWTGSWNATANDTFRNNNNMLRFVSREIASNYTREFEQMFAGHFGNDKVSGSPYPNVQLGDARVSVYFSPADGVAKYVLDRIEQAQKSIRFMTFSYTSDPISDAMVAQTRAGLTVQGVFERQNVRGTGSDFEKLRSGGVDILEDGSCYILHHKVILIDDQTVITGSYNFTRSAERDNDENLVIIDDPVLARAYLEEFNRLYAQAQSPTRCR